MKTSILSLALGVVLASPVSAYATERAYVPATSNRIVDYLGAVPYGDSFAAPSDAGSTWRDPFKPRTTDGLSGNPDACASYGCVGAGGDD